MARALPKHKAIKSLSSERQDQILQMLRAGKKADHIAGVIQDGWQALPDMKRESLVRAITRFRSDFVRTNMEQLLLESGALDKAAQIAWNFDALDELQRLYYLQQTRIAKLLDFEQTLPDGLLHNQLSDELRLASKMLARIGLLQLETGILRRAPKDVEAPPPDDTSVVHFRTNEASEKPIAAERSRWH
jgi:hypothetical protein